MFFGSGNIIEYPTEEKRFLYIIQLSDEKGIIYRAKRATTAPKRAAEEATRPEAPLLPSPLPDSVALASLPVLEALSPPDVPVGLVAPVPVASEPAEPVVVLEASPPLPSEPAEELLPLPPEPELPLPPEPPLLPPLPELGVPVDSGVPTEVCKYPC